MNSGFRAGVKLALHLLVHGVNFVKKGCQQCIFPFRYKLYLQNLLYIYRYSTNAFNVVQQLISHTSTISQSIIKLPQTL
jgi:hypothetical protein